MLKINIFLFLTLFIQGSSFSVNSLVSIEALAVVLNMLILEREENRSTQRKSTGEINHEELHSYESPTDGRRREAQHAKRLATRDC